MKICTRIIAARISMEFNVVDVFSESDFNTVFSACYDGHYLNQVIVKRSKSVLIDCRIYISGFFLEIVGMIIII